MSACAVGGHLVGSAVCDRHKDSSAHNLIALSLSLHYPELRTHADTCPAAGKPNTSLNHKAGELFWQGWK